MLVKLIIHRSMSGHSCIWTHPSSVRQRELFTPGCCCVRLFVWRVKHRTLGNLSDCSEAEINAIRVDLKHKDQLADMLEREALDPKPSKPPEAGLRSPSALAAEAAPSFVQGPGVGAIAILQGLAGELGIVAALGDDREGRLALWQIK